MQRIMILRKPQICESSNISFQLSGVAQAFGHATKFDVTGVSSTENSTPMIGWPGKQTGPVAKAWYSFSTILASLLEAICPIIFFPAKHSQASPSIPQPPGITEPVFSRLKSHFTYYRERLRKNYIP